MIHGTTERGKRNNRLAGIATFVVLGLLVVLIIGLWWVKEQSESSAPQRDAGPEIVFPPSLRIYGSPTHLLVREGYVYISLQRGEVLRIPLTPDPLTEVYLDFTDKVYTHPEGPELGLQSIAFTPEGVAAFYTTETGVEVSLENGEVLFSAERIVPEGAVDRPMFWAHNGGHALMGPDGYLWLTLGEGFVNPSAPSLTAQDPSNPWGSIVRYDLEARESEVWAWGLRNPWRIAFAPDGTLVASDVGEGSWEEVNIIHKGGNYGWPIMEGRECYYDAKQKLGTMVIERPCAPEDYTAPFWAYSHDGTVCAIIGGVFHKDRYYYSDWCNGAIVSISLISGSASVTSKTPLEVRGFYSDGDTLYILGRDRTETTTEIFYRVYTLE